MDERTRSDREAQAINDRMAAEMERRRQIMPNRRKGAATPPLYERRTICGYCFQRGDHPTAAHCLRALERPDRVINSGD